MNLTERDQKLYERVAGILQERESVGYLKEEDISRTDLFSLLNSQVPDLSILGTYLLSMMPSLPEPQFFLKEKNAARNYVRYSMAEQAANKEKFDISPLTAEIPVFHQNYDELLAQFNMASQYTSKPSPKNIDLTIIVHGTFAATSIWWQPGSAFWSHINNITQNVYSGSNPFCWTGNNNHKDRVIGAQNLISWCKKHTFKEIDIIAHSHGGNVCLYASSLGLKIRKLILLGTPIRLEYLPDLKNIKEVHNIFSTGDLVQKPGTFPNRRSEGRTLADSLTITNHRAENNEKGNNPGHSELHEPATWNTSNLNRVLCNNLTSWPNNRIKADAKQLV